MTFGHTQTHTVKYSVKSAVKHSCQISIFLSPTAPASQGSAACECNLKSSIGSLLTGRSENVNCQKNNLYHIFSDVSDQREGEKGQNSISQHQFCFIIFSQNLCVVFCL